MTAARGLVVAACIAGAGACTRSAPEPARPDPVARADASAASRLASPPASAAIYAAPDAGPAVAWTDPRAIRELAKDCAWQPAQEDPPNMDRPSPLGCGLPYDQACVADPCYHGAREDCRKACGETCATCGGACTVSCDRCKAGCKDDACRLRCATLCGQCKQDCLTARDRCGSATCTTTYEKCRTDLVSGWLKNNCDAVCVGFNACWERCQNRASENEDCMEKCTRTVAGAKACNPNPMLCPEMRNAAERKKLDPKWKTNKCDELCARVWTCAKETCAKTPGCGEDIKMFDRCFARAGAQACGDKGQFELLCPEP